MTDNKSKLQALEDALDRVQKKQKISYEKTMQQIDLLIGEINKCKAELEAGIYRFTILPQIAIFQYIISHS
jgi:hypothetical protein